MSLSMKTWNGNGPVMPRQSDAEASARRLRRRVLKHVVPLPFRARRRGRAAEPRVHPRNGKPKLHAPTFRTQSV